jgi:hypothetical protein
MAQDLRWKCLSEGKAWMFMKLSLAMVVLGLGMRGYLLFAHGSETFGGYLQLLFLAFWSGIIGMVGLVLASAWLMWRAMTNCR